MEYVGGHITCTFYFPKRLKCIVWTFTQGASVIQMLLFLVLKIVFGRDWASY